MIISILYRGRRHEPIAIYYYEIAMCRPIRRRRERRLSAFREAHAFACDTTLEERRSRSTP